MEKKTPLNRRDFLRLSANTIEAAILTACGKKAKPLTSTELAQKKLKDLLQTPFSEITEAQGGQREAVAYIINAQNAWSAIVVLEDPILSKGAGIVPLSDVMPEVVQSSIVIGAVTFLETNGPILGIDKNGKLKYVPFLTKHNTDTEVYIGGWEHAPALGAVSWFISSSIDSRYNRYCNFWERTATQSGFSIYEIDDNGNQKAKHTNISRAVANFLATCVKEGYTSEFIPQDINVFQENAASQLIAIFMKDMQITIGELYMLFRICSPEILIGRISNKDVKDFDKQELGKIYAVLDALLGGIELGLNEPSKSAEGFYQAFKIQKPTPVPLPGSQG